MTSMARKVSDTIRMVLPEGARKPTDDEIRAAKEYILRRSEAASAAQDIAGDYIEDVAVELVRIAYKYNVPISEFLFDSSVDEDMMDEVTEVMEMLDEQLYDTIELYALSCAPYGSDRHYALLALFLTLGHRNLGMRETLFAYEWRMLRQAEALIASYRSSGLTLDEALKKMRLDIKNFTASPDLRSAFSHRSDFSAPYILNGGKATFPDGSPNVKGVAVDGYNAIKFLFGAATAQIWMRNQMEEMREQENCIGYWQDRGGNYPCDLCEGEVGFHTLEEGSPDDEPLVHFNCMCWRCPIYI